MVRVEQIIAGIGGYIENEFIKSLPAKRPARVAIGVAATMFLLNNQGKLKKALDSDMAAAFGLSSQNGDYDMRPVKETILRFMSDEGMDVDFATYVPNIKTLPIIGNMINNGEFPEKITLYKQDMEKIFEYIGG